MDEAIDPRRVLAALSWYGDARRLVSTDADPMSDAATVERIHERARELFGEPCAGAAWDRFRRGDALSWYARTWHAIPMMPTADMFRAAEDRMHARARDVFGAPVADEAWAELLANMESNRRSRTQLARTVARR